MTIDPKELKSIQGKNILLGVTGSIAAYKAAEITSLLVKAGAEVHVVMTESATRFITPLTLQTLSRNPVSHNIWDEENGWQPGHIELADQCDLFLVAPLTANTIANFAHGIASDLLSAIYLANRSPVLLAPAMNGKMWEHPATLENREKLEKRGHIFISPVEGMLACGYEGCGKLAPVEDIVKAIDQLFQTK
jgi:phosphopantothenoylcysteine decarboxylase/phosphopantothenate--cysteine ligase